jgi:hypothetical protein
MDFCLGFTSFIMRLPDEGAALMLLLASFAVTG